VGSGLTNGADSAWSRGTRGAGPWRHGPHDFGPVVASARPALGAVAPTPACDGLSTARHKAKSRGAATQSSEQRSGFGWAQGEGVRHGLIRRRRMQREGQFCPAGIHGARAMVATRSQSSVPRLGLQGCGTRVDGVFPWAERTRLGARAPARLGVRASVAPAIPSQTLTRAVRGGCGTEGGRRINRDNCRVGPAWW
jgi:hypothetical protein